MVITAQLGKFTKKSLTFILKASEFYGMYSELYLKKAITKNYIVLGRISPLIFDRGYEHLIWGGEKISMAQFQPQLMALLKAKY